VASDINGNFPYKMDPKYRVSVPASWRPLLGDSFQLMEAERKDQPMIIVLTEADYNERLRLIREFEGVDEATKREAEGMFHSRCRPAAINDQGKMLVPKDLAEYAGVQAGAPVVLEGRGQHFAIWSPEKFKLVQESVSKDEKIKQLALKTGVFS